MLYRTLKRMIERGQTNGLEPDTYDSPVHYESEEISGR